MVNQNGWPEELQFVYDRELNGASTVGFEQDEYKKAMDQAKADAVPFQDERSVKRLLLDLVNWHACNIDSSFPIKFKSDTFIDVDIEVDFVKQYKSGPNDSWLDVPKGDGTIFAWETRTVARVVPERKNGDIWYEGSELKAKVLDEEHSITAAQINDECQKHNDELVKQLKAAQARIKQLEQENGEGFEKYQELLVENRNLKDRVRELEEMYWIAEYALRDIDFIEDVQGDEVHADDFVAIARRALNKLHTMPYPVKITETKTEG